MTFLAFGLTGSADVLVRKRDAVAQNLFASLICGRGRPRSQ